jgi:2-polyprenyl-3-methyl-5-hydroxy-6-metoxy-1,4-benzoquinol methylase
MRWRGPLARSAGALELLDGTPSFADHRRSLLDVARLNALFGGRRVTLVEVKRLLAGLPEHRTAIILDVGTGAGDIPVALVRWARRARRSLRVYALDRDEAALRVAREVVARYPEIVLLRGDALALPVAPGAVDIVISALTLHHLEPAAAARCLGAMDEAARAGLVVNDLARSRAGWALVWLATRLLARSRLSRHDGPLSVLRAYSTDELRALGSRAGLGRVEVRRYPPLLRQCLVKAKPP